MKIDCWQQYMMAKVLATLSVDFKAYKYSNDHDVLANNENDAFDQKRTQVL
jgi:hypothetical protein